MTVREPRLEAVLFDMDGTIADTEPLWERAKDAVARRHGIAWSVEDGVAAVGQPTPVYSAEFVARGASASAAEIADEITLHVAEGLADGVVWRAGALRLIGELVDAGVRTALVTMAYRPVAEALARATGLAVFDVIVAGDDVERSKPDPEPYLRAMAALGVSPATSVAVEDTETGARSAFAAGLATLVVPSAPGIAAARGRVVKGSLADVRMADLRALLESAVS